MTKIIAFVAILSLDSNGYFCLIDIAGISYGLGFKTK